MPSFGDVAKAVLSAEAKDTRRSSLLPGPSGQVAGAASEAGGSLLSGRMAARVRLILLLCALLGLVLWLRDGPVAAGQGALETSLAAYAERHAGLEISAGQVAWLGRPAGPLSFRPVVFVAHAADELPDLYYADVRASEAGNVLDLLFLQNLTRSSSAAEGSLLQTADRLAFTVQVGERFDAIVVLDTTGEPRELTANWPAFARLQNAITNVQETGRARAFGRYRYSLVPPARTLKLRVSEASDVALLPSTEGAKRPSREGGSPTALPAGREGRVPLPSTRSTLRVLADSERIAIDLASLEVETGKGRVRLQPPAKGRPGVLTWMVDTVRNLSFVGPEPIEWLEHTVFGITDRAERAYHGVVRADTEAEVREALPMVDDSERKRALLTVNDPELGWPPAPLKPLLSDKVRGEGEWHPVVDDPFVNDYPNAPPAFYQSFLRVDEERLYTRVYMTLWDPRQVQLRIVMGTREPESATGETGSGSISRDPRVLKRLVGGFNGGFQAMHGEFGMMSEGRVYLPPKPWAATLAVREDGRVGMGSWPGPGRGAWDEESANRQIPPDVISMRQNLTSVVEDGVWNPWKRWWWGAAPTFAKEQTYIHRSGICLTEEGFMAYLWGESMGPEELGKAMLALRCVRGMHLDMNSKHTGFEFYNPSPADSELEPLGRPLSDAEFEGPMPQTPSMRVRARKAVTTMSPLRFPRYLQRDPRDFFYLTLKPVLPGPDLLVGSQAIPFSTEGLPHAGWPHAFARAQLADAAGRGTWFVRIDPGRAVPGPVASEALGRPLGYLLPLRTAVESQGRQALCAERGPDLLWLYAVRPAPDLGTDQAPTEPAADSEGESGCRTVLEGPALADAPRARAAIGVDGDGFLVYAEASAADRDSLGDRLQRAGVERSIAVEQLAFATENRLVSADGGRELSLDLASAVPLLAETRPRAETMFPEVEPMPYRRWGWLQGQRVRYFPDGEPRFKAPDGVLP